MPVEECGNALISASAVAYFGDDEDQAFLTEHQELLNHWADYLLENGYDPGMQLCTDDFAGHLARNCNLSAKAIVALAAYGKMSDQVRYLDAARGFAKRWELDAKDEHSAATRLAFDQEGTWSLKYNLIWDRLLGLDLFQDSTYKAEVQLYQEKMNRYGMPLDYRSDYTKVDWLAWTTFLADDAAFKTDLYQAIWQFINETRHRVPISDWYYSSTADQVVHSHRYLGFQNRTVVGGLFVNLLEQ